MDKKLKNPSENGWAGENVFSTIVLVVLSAVLFVVGLFFINDMLVKPIMVILNGPVVRQGKALYTDGEFLDYNGGTSFQKAVDNTILKDFEVMEFYYVDNSYIDFLSDNHQMIDIYALSYNLGNQYDSIKDSLISIGKFQGVTYINDNDIYEINEGSDLDANIMVIFSESDKLIYLVYFYGTEDGRIGDPGTLLYQHGHFDWIYKKTGDGSVVPDDH